MTIKADEKSVYGKKVHDNFTSEVMVAYLRTRADHRTGKGGSSNC